MMFTNIKPESVAKATNVLNSPVWFFSTVMFITCLFSPVDTILNVTASIFIAGVIFVILSAFNTLRAVIVAEEAKERKAVVDRYVKNKGFPVDFADKKPLLHTVFPPVLLDEKEVNTEMQFNVTR